ncbi:hypothetical protein BDN71DRAFT_1452503 [Pleurotus eryngii]|uniref:Uncharacterized protein n=1 Tax=Pleurotus eryngii TaxID=5323 RepID=A0A9P5ZR56_PLEER|nr:hypothetical protein BDN71DRAFT_1452503 [Pleurotus eryngii]
MSTPATRLAIHYLPNSALKLPSPRPPPFAAKVAAQTNAHPQRTLAPESWLNALTTARSRQQVPLPTKHKPSAQGSRTEIERNPEERRSSPHGVNRPCREDTSPAPASTAHHPPSLSAMPCPCPAIP